MVITGSLRGIEEGFTPGGMYDETTIMVISSLQMLLMRIKENQLEMTRCRIDCAV